MNAREKSVIETAAATTSNAAAELSNTLHEAGELSKAAVRLADQTVRENTWIAIGAAAGVGLLFGLLLRRR